MTAVAKRRIVPLAIAASFSVAACSNPIGPSSGARDQAASISAPATIQDVFARFVALGTSISMGVQAAGIFAPAQQAAWPGQLAARAGAAFSLPLVQDPGCGPPLLPPLASDLVLAIAFGGDLATGVTDTCAPLRSGLTLPTNNVAISGANVHDALTTTPEAAASASSQRGALYSRVLAPGETQVSAMLAENPTLVAVELAANDVLPASRGRIEAMTPYANWQRDYDAVLAAVKSKGARALLVGLPSNAANFPTVRSSREFFNQWPALLALGITVSRNCYSSTNQLFVPGYLLTLISKAPTTATCANVPGAVDYVLTSSDVAAINARMAQMNAHMKSKATENGYAYFSLDAVYALPKPAFSVSGLLFSGQPFGANVSLDGVHPSSAGQGLLAAAAAKALNAAYGLGIP